jgi:hypothetical protein
LDTAAGGGSSGFRSINQHNHNFFSPEKVRRESKSKLPAVNQGSPNAAAVPKLFQNLTPFNAPSGGSNKRVMISPSTLAIQNTLLEHRGVVAPGHGNVASAF